MADPGAFVIDPRWLEDAQVVRFNQLMRQKQWVKALEIGEFVLNDLPGSRECARTSAAA